MTRKTPTIEDYKELAAMCNRVRQDLMDMGNFAYRRCGAPKSITRFVYIAVDKIDRFRSDMEDRMFHQTPWLPNEALEIFYPSRQSIRKK